LPHIGDLFELNVKLRFQRLNITVTYVANTTHRYCDGILELYFTTYSLTKLCANAVYVF